MAERASSTAMSWSGGPPAAWERSSIRRSAGSSVIGFLFLPPLTGDMGHDATAQQIQIPLLDRIDYVEMVLCRALQLGKRLPLPHGGGGALLTHVSISSRNTALRQKP